MTKWNRPRQELIQIGVELARRGYDARYTAENMANQHFLGVDLAGATRRLQRAIQQAFWKQHAGLTEHQQELHDMHATLRAEGWRPLFDTDGQGCFWLHESGQSVNSGGGFFHCYEAATRTAFNSATRAILKGECDENPVWQPALHELCHLRKEAH